MRVKLEVPAPGICGDDAPAAGGGALAFAEAERDAAGSAVDVLEAPARRVALLGLATAVPPYVLAQEDVAARASRLLAPVLRRHPNLREVFANAGVERRFAARPIEWYEEPRGWPERNAAYLEAASALYAEAAEAALRQSGVSARDIGCVVTVSSTGIATPSLEARLASQLGLSPDAARVPVFGLGCAGGVSGLSLAARLARAEPDRPVLFVTVELCTLSFRFERARKADVIATALFGDGAAAAVLHGCAEADARPGRRARGRASDHAYRRPLRRAWLGQGFEHTWPDTLDIMGWSVDPIGLGVILSRSLPKFVEQRLADVVGRHFPQNVNGLAPRFICHPGGAKVVRAVESALGVPEGALAEERGVLRDFGNMSAPTVLFVLERLLASGYTGSGILSALGPGFTASFLRLEA